MHSDNREGDGKFWDDTFERADSALLARNVSGWNEVHWATSDEDSTEYRHIATLPFKGVTFEFSAEHLELLIAANSFEPIRDRGKIIFALRGAKLHVSGGASADDKYHQVDRTALHLVETRPDHQHFRCVIGVYDTERRQLSGFIANTVPCRQAIYGYANGGDLSNMLPSGSYRMVVGTHKG